VGVANAASTVQYRVYRSGTAAPGWTDATVVSYAGGVLRTRANAVSSVAAELATRTADFALEVRAQDHLGNWGPAASVTWHHHPLAPPIDVAWQDQITNPASSHYARSIHRMSATPASGQQELASAMSVGYARDNARAIGSFVVTNPHAVPVRVGFFVPKPSAATYTRVVADVSPWLTFAAGGGIPVPPYPCGGSQGDLDQSFRANSNGTYTCPPIMWSEPAEDTTAPGTVNAALPSSFATEVRLYSGGTLQPRLLAADGASETIVVGGVTYDFFEFSAPASATVTALVMLPSLDLFTPKSDSDSPGTYAGVVTAPGEMLDGTTGIQLSGVLYETWGDCIPTSGDTCTLRKRVHYRGTTSAGLTINQYMLRMKVRTRAVATTTSLEAQPLLGDTVAELVNPNQIAWSTAEPKYPTGSNTKRD
jgi:hypothetical protein